MLNKVFIGTPINKPSMEDNKPLTPNTTEQQDITKAGQRRINLIWEFTQAMIALMITAAIIFKPTKDEVLNYAFFLIVSMYFIRTNHKLIGGVGEKVPEQFQQR